MDNSKTSTSKQHEPDSAPQPRLNKKHGVRPEDLVEAIAPEELVTVNAPDCKHKTMSRDPSETEFNAFICDNPACGIVVLVSKK